MHARRRTLEQNLLKHLPEKFSVLEAIQCRQLQLVKLPSRCQDTQQQACRKVHWSLVRDHASWSHLALIGKSGGETRELKLKTLEAREEVIGFGDWAAHWARFDADGLGFSEEAEPSFCPGLDCVFESQTEVAGNVCRFFSGEV